MDATTESNLEFVRRYLAAVSNFAMGDELAAFYHPEVNQIEFPNRLVPNGAERDLKALQAGAEAGRRVMTAQTYDIQNVIASDDQIALEVIWTGTLAVPLGALAVGDVMRAHFAVFLTFRDGRILSQHNYDCFDPF